MPALSALVVSLNENHYTRLAQQLQHEHNFKVYRAANEESLEQELKRRSLAVVFVDLEGDIPSANLSARMQEVYFRDDLHVPLVAVCSHCIPCEWAVPLHLLGIGSIDSSVDPLPLADVLKSAVARRDLNGDATPTGERAIEGQSGKFITYTPEMFSTLDELEMAATHDVTMLLVGETGTGKTYLARVAHEMSPRAGERFMPVACGALPPDLIESELFGHVKGSFTGADRDKVGKFEAAGNGTLLLDEIDVLGPEQQAKLLRVIETGEFEPVGSNETRVSHARLIVASNLDLESMISKDRFRADLYYRLNVLQFYVPPLRKRRQDIIPMAMQFIRKFSESYDVPVRRVHVDFLEFLRSYAWPGNVRELENLIRRVVLFCRNGDITLDDLPPTVAKAHSASVGFAARSLPEGTSALVERVALTEQETIDRALRANKFKRAPTARALGISRVTLYNKMKKYDMLHITAESETA